MRRMLSAAGAWGIFAACLTVGVADLAGQTAGAGTVARAVASTRSANGLLPGTRPGIFTTIQGNALNATNGSLPGSIVRLRDVRVGRIVDSQLTDRAGLFAFRTVDPGSYIVEIVGNNAAVMATSQVLSVNAGEAVSTIVKMPFRIPPFAGLVGQSTQTAASQTVVAAAASTGVLTSGPLDVCVSGPCQ